MFQITQKAKRNSQEPSARQRHYSARGMLLTCVASTMFLCGAANADQTPAENLGKVACSGVGQVWWNELLAPETEQLSTFYEKVFGWSKAIVDVELQRPPATSPDDKYVMFTNNKQEVAGLMRYHHPDAPSSNVGWFVYIQVANVKTSVEHVQNNGGTIIYEPAEMPDGNTIAVVRDPKGNIFGLVTPASASNC